MLTESTTQPACVRSVDSSLSINVTETEGSVASHATASTLVDRHISSLLTLAYCCSIQQVSFRGKKQQMVRTKSYREKRQSRKANGYEKAICPPCNTILVGAREPGEMDYCLEAEREVRLQPIHQNPHSAEASHIDEPYDFAPEKTWVRNAIKRHRDGERVPVHIPADKDGVVV